MTSLTLSLKTAVIAGTLVAGTAAGFVLIANTRNETQVGGTQTEASGVSQGGTGTDGVSWSDPTQQSTTSGTRVAPSPRPSPTPRNDGNGNSDGEGPGAGGGVQTGTFEISGSVDGLFPGASRPLELTFDNPATFAIRVTQLEVVAANSDDPNCTKNNLETPAGAIDVLVPGNASATHTAFVAMANDPHNSCQGATWTLTYTATAVKA